MSSKGPPLAGLRGSQILNRRDRRRAISSPQISPTGQLASAGPSREQCRAGDGSEPAPGSRARGPFFEGEEDRETSVKGEGRGWPGASDRTGFPSPVSVSSFPLTMRLYPAGVVHPGRPERKGHFWFRNALAVPDTGSRELPLTPSRRLTGAGRRNARPEGSSENEEPVESKAPSMTPVARKGARVGGKSGKRHERCPEAGDNVGHESCG